MNVAAGEPRIMRTPHEVACSSYNMRFTVVCRDEPSGAQLLSLDVGGTVYTAAQQTFTAVPDSWFTKVVSGSIQLPRTAQDILFVDRDAHVRSILPC